ncbi:phage tail terminator protein [Rodentibacter caecimuris]|uniref:phage tail terminator protein n=1 Tax=Rodentibacter caecimuris TaxID=1796644 RepID=UPI0009876C39|nr:phage tail protein [Rodentibacter heylii]
MLIHQKIRHQIVELLKPQITGVQHFYSGRPLFIDIDQDKSAIAVFIDDIQCDELTLCSHEWEASLNIAIYLKTSVGEDELDNIAEQIKSRLMTAIENDELPSQLNEITLSGYTYEQDQTNRTWFVANVRYQIKYED